MAGFYFGSTIYMTITRRNHYVPEWYQKRFLSSKNSAFYYLDLIPSVIDLPNGRKKTLNGIRWPFSPSHKHSFHALAGNGYLSLLDK